MKNRKNEGANHKTEHQQARTHTSSTRSSHTRTHARTHSLTYLHAELVYALHERGETGDLAAHRVHLYDQVLVDAERVHELRGQHHVGLAHRCISQPHQPQRGELSQSSQRLDAERLHEARGSRLQVAVTLQRIDEQLLHGGDGVVRFQPAVIERRVLRLRVDADGLVRARLRRGHVLVEGGELEESVVLLVAVGSVFDLCACVCVCAFVCAYVRSKTNKSEKMNKFSFLLQLVW